MARKERGKRGLPFVAFLFCLGAAVSTSMAADSAGQIDPRRADEIAAFMSERPFAFGPPISDRAAWAALGRQRELRTAIAMAEADMDRPLPELSDDLFLEFSRTGNRADYEREYFDRTGRLTPLVIAECIEQHRRFIPAIENLVLALAAQKTWMLPAHDGGLKNFHGEEIDIDLFSSALACDLAEADHLLGDELSARTRRIIQDNLRRRVLDPFRDMVTGGRPPNWWLTGQNNWNAVCQANVLGAALASLPDRHDRAIFAAAAERDSLNYLRGFASDGFCVEGLGYWNYGFGNYIRLCEMLYQSTAGKVDCFNRPKVGAIAAFPRALEIMPGIYPAYGDVHLDAQPWPPLVDFVDRRFGLPGAASGQSSVLSKSLGGSLAETLMFSCVNSASDRPVVASQAPALRSWFSDAQVLTCRPLPGPEPQMGVSIKGGRNGVSHGHDDLGSFVLVVGDQALLVDPGTEIYTARTFSKNRYQSKVINSFGHNVPTVAGELQISTSRAQVKILERNFAEATSSVSMDLTSAYPAPELKELRRDFLFDHRGETLTIQDTAEFSTPQTLGVTFVTFGHWRRVSATQLLVWQHHRAVEIDLDADGRDLAITSEEIDEDLPEKVKPTRIAVQVKIPARWIALKAAFHVSHAPTD
jgi:Heparinase II/III-like protein